MNLKFIKVIIYKQIFEFYNEIRIWKDDFTLNIAYVKIL